MPHWQSFFIFYHSNSLRLHNHTILTFPDKQKIISCSNIDYVEKIIIQIFIIDQKIFDLNNHKIERIVKLSLF